MALITCPECGKQISDRAARCPKCGIPMEKIHSLLKQLEAESIAKETDVDNAHPQEQVVPTVNAPVHPTEPPLQTTNPSEAMVDGKNSEKSEEQGVLSEEAQANTVPEEAKKKRHSLTLILVIAGIVLLAGGVGFWFYRTNIYLPAKRDAEAARFYVLAESLKMRSSPEFDADYNKIGTFPYGTEILVYDSMMSCVEPYIYGKYVVKDAHGKVIKDKCVEGYMSHYYMANKADFFLLNGIFGNEDARKMLSEVRYKRALLNYFKQHHYRGYFSSEKMAECGVTDNYSSAERWQVFCRYEKAKSNNVYRSRKFRKDSKFTDLAVIIKNIDSGERRLLYFVFDDDESYRLLLEQPVPATGYMKDRTLKLKELSDGTYCVYVEFENE